MGGKGAVRRACTYNLGMVKYSVVAARCVQSSVRRRSASEGVEGKACQLRQGPPADQGCSISSWDGEAEKETI